MISDDLRRRVRAAIPAYYVVDIRRRYGRLEVVAEPPDGNPGFQLVTAYVDDDSTVTRVIEWISREPWDNMRLLFPDDPEVWMEQPPDWPPSS